MPFRPIDGTYAVKTYWWYIIMPFIPTDGTCRLDLLVVYMPFTPTDGTYAV